MKAKKEAKTKEEVHEALVELRKKYGDNVLTRADEGYPPVEVIPTGCFAIDRVIGVGGLPRGRILELYGEPSCQPGGESVLMANGEWKRIEDIKLGDKIISPQRAGPSIIGTVLNITEWESPEIYKIIRNDDDSILYRCSGNHIIPHKAWKNIKIPKSSKEMSVHLIRERTARELYLDKREKVSTTFSTSEIDWGNKVNPSLGGYTLGLLLSDGSFCGGRVRITAGKKDAEYEIKRITEEGTILGPLKIDKRNNNVTTIPLKNSSELLQAQWLKKSGLINKNGHSKFIPQQALYASVQYRKNLLAGLIDGDGSLITKRGKGNRYPRARWDYSTVSYRLANDIYFLVHSLGGYCSIAKRTTTCNGKSFESFRLYISIDDSLPVALWRKHGFGPRNKGKNIREKLSTYHGFRVEKESRGGRVFGFTLDTPSQWYITNNFIVTHNSGKTASCLYLISEVQKQGGTCAFLDAEYSFNVDFAASIGVDTKKLFVSQPSTLEEGADTLRALIATNQIDLIVVDSVAALVPKREVEGEEMLANSMAVQAQLMSKMLRVLTGEVARSKTVVIFINHLKEKMGIFWGDKTTTPGGKSLKFFASVRLAVSRGEKITGKHDEQIGSIIKIVAQKNKVAAPWRKGEFTLYYETGVDHEADTLDTAIESGVISKSGNTLEFNGKKIGVGRDQGIRALKDDPELFKEIRSLTAEAVKKDRS